MSEWKVEVVKIGNIEKHPNADTLEITRVHGGYPCIIKSGSFKPGDLAIYIPIDSVVDRSDPRFSFLKNSGKIKASRLRGVFSMGLLIPVEPGMNEGDIVHEKLNITKYEPPEPVADNDSPAPFHFPTYTDIEGFRRWPNIFQPNEEVIITEKCHGENARFIYKDGRLWIGSRTNVKKPGLNNSWNKNVEKFNLEEILKNYNKNIILYGESAGHVGGFPYGTKKGDVIFLGFDVFDLERNDYVNFNEFETIMMELGLPMAPVLYRGPYSEDKVYELANGKSILDNSHIREGVVIRPVNERWHDKLGRVILKMHGEKFLMKA